MIKTPSVNQITSAYTGHMPQLAKRVNDDKQAHGGIAQDLRMLMAEADMTKALQSSQTQAALQQPQNPPTVAQGIHDRLRQLTQGQPRMQPQAAQPQFQGAPQAPQGLAQLQAGQNTAPPAPNIAPPQGLPDQGIDQLPANVGQSYAHGGIIGYDGTDGSYVDERDALRRMEAATYDQTNPVAPAAPRTAASVIQEAIAADPEALRAAAEARRNSIKRDTSAMDQMQAEYKAEKERLTPPKQGYDAFMELMGQIANAPRGVGSLTAGSMGVQKVKEMEQARALQRHELTKQMLDVGQKKADIGYTQSLEAMGAGDAAKAAALKEQYAAAIASSNNEMEKAKLAQDLKLKLAQLEVEKQRTSAMHINPMLQVAEALKNASPEDRKIIEGLHAAQYGNKASLQAAQTQQMIGNDLADIDKAYKEDPRLIGALPGAKPEAKADFAKMQEEIEKKKNKVIARYLNPATQGLPELAAKQEAAPSAGGYTVTVGGKTFAFPTQEDADKFKRDAGAK